MVCLPQAVPEEFDLFEIKVGDFIPIELFKGSFKGGFLLLRDVTNHFGSSSARGRFTLFFCVGFSCRPLKNENAGRK